MVLQELGLAFGALGLGSVFRGDAVAVARVAQNMRAAAFTDEEVAQMLKALYISKTKQDARAAWAVLDRRRTGTMHRAELEDALVSMFGTAFRRPIQRLLNRLPSAAIPTAAGQMVESSEFTSIAGELAQLGRGESLPAYLATETAAWFSEATQGLADASKAWTALELDVLAKVPPHLLPRAGAVVQRFVHAGYTAHDASTAVAALYGPRQPIHVARLWGLFDVKREGHISGGTFDQAMALLTDVVGPHDMPTLRTQLGFVDADVVTVHEFEAALRLLVPPDGSPPRLGHSDTTHDLTLAELLGSGASVQRLKPFQRQRAMRLAQRMRNFGYARESIALLCKTLFLTRLHDRDLWSAWVMLHPTPPTASSSGSGSADGGAGGAGAGGEARAGGGGASVHVPPWSTEAPLQVDQVRHLLALLSEPGEGRDAVNELVEKIDVNHSGDIEFEELATLIRALNPQQMRHKDLKDVTFEAHPLLAQVQALADTDTLGIMYATPGQLASAAGRARKLGSVIHRLDGTTPPDAVGDGAVAEGTKAAANRRAFERATQHMLQEVADEQLEAARAGQQRQTLQAYCSDTYCEALACLAQALHHAASMLEASGTDSYDAHVALRTIRTVEQAERLLPSKRVDWRMRLDDPSAPTHHVSAAAAEEDEAAAPRLTEDSRNRIERIYARGGKGKAVGIGGAAAAAAPSAAEAAAEAAEAAAREAEMDAKAQRVFERVTTGNDTLDAARNRLRKKTSAVEAAKRRKQMLAGGSQAAHLADQLRGEHEDAVVHAAKLHMRKLRSGNIKAERQWIVLGAS